MMDSEKDLVKHLLKSIVNYNKIQSPEFRRYVQEAAEQGLKIMEMEYERRV